MRLLAIQLANVRSRSVPILLAVFAKTLNSAPRPRAMMAIATTTSMSVKPAVERRGKERRAVNRCVIAQHHCGQRSRYRPACLQ